MRHSLSVLFNGFADEGRLLVLPSDVYPVYHTLAHDAGAEITTYQTLTDRIEFPEGDVLLICNPAKPRGSSLSRAELVDVIAWLARGDHRRVVIDAVYTFDTRFDDTTLALLETGKAILLHSLSKGWLHPVVMGVAVFPEQDVERWRGVFRDLPTDQPKLQLAQALLTQVGSFPSGLRVELDRATSRMVEVLGGSGLACNPIEAPRYLHVVNINWLDALRQHRLLTLPPSVFGSTRDDITIVSSLILL